MDGKKLHLSPLTNAFPCISHLELNLKGASFKIGSFRTFGNIPELWPKLEELRLSFLSSCMKKNLDAEFGGINEEVDFLRQQNNDYLAAVYLLPVRPCLLTMSGQPPINSVQFLEAGGTEEVIFSCICCSFEKAMAGVAAEISQWPGALEILFLKWLN